MSYRSICNKCGRTGIGADYSEAQPKIVHKDSCPNAQLTKVVKEIPKVVKAKKSKKSSSSED